MGRPRLEQFALFLMLAGSVLFPWGWLVGIVLVWWSRRWSVRDKLIATLCPPFGFMPAIGLFGPARQSCTGGMTASGRVWSTAPVAPRLTQAVAIAAAIVLTIMPFVTAVIRTAGSARRAARRASRPPEPAALPRLGQGRRRGRRARAAGPDRDARALQALDPRRLARRR